MTDIMWCPNCKTNREVKPKINWIITILLFILGIIFGIIYVAYCYIEKKRCAVCGTSVSQMQPMKFDNIQN